MFEALINSMSEFWSRPLLEVWLKSMMSGQPSQENYFKPMALTQMAAFLPACFSSDPHTRTCMEKAGEFMNAFTVFSERLNDIASCFPMPQTTPASYTEILKSPGYIQLLHRTVDAYNDMCLAGNQMLDNWRSRNDSPKNGNVDEVTKEIKELKEKLEVLMNRLGAGRI